MKLKTFIAATLIACLFCIMFAACSGSDQAEETTTALKSTVATESTTKKAVQKKTEAKDIKDVTEGEAMTYGENGKTGAAVKTTRTTVRTTSRVTTRATTRPTAPRTTASNNDAGCIDDGAMTY